MPFVHFLLVYDRSQQRLIFERPYTDSAEALREYEAMEERHRHDTDKEIVLVGADSIETVRVTHGNYFDVESGTHPAASPYLAGV
jgi:hypothetical protein